MWPHSLHGCLVTASLRLIDKGSHPFEVKLAARTSMAIGGRSLTASAIRHFVPDFVGRGTLCSEPLACEKFLRRQESALPVGIDRRYDPRPRNGPVEIPSDSSAPIEFLPHALPNLGDAKFSGFCHAAKVFDSFSSVGFIAVPLCDEPSRRIVLPPHVLRGIPPQLQPL